jgi:hypothetical protein
MQEVAEVMPTIYLREKLTTLAALGGKLPWDKTTVWHNPLITDIEAYAKACRGRDSLLARRGKLTPL